MNKLPIELVYKIVNYIYKPSYCVLEDCNRPNCHNCFPVLSCSEHEKCINYGQFIEYNDYIISEITKDKATGYKNNYPKDKNVCLKCK